MRAGTQGCSAGEQAISVPVTGMTGYGSGGNVHAELIQVSGGAGVNDVQDGTCVRTPAGPEVPPVFRFPQRWADLDDAECWRVFNMGVGMAAVMGDGGRAVEVLRARGVDAWVCGEVVEGEGVRMR
ncbi:MAG: AIR synthase-related protein [Egibacteraceae bacterium]